MSFNSLISSEEKNDSIEKIYTKLLAFGVRDFTEYNRIIEKFQKISSSQISNDKLIDQLVYEHLSQEQIPETDFSVKHVLALTFSEKKNYGKILSNIDSIFPQRTKVSSMIPSPIHFGPLEGFLSDSFSDIDLKTLFITIGIWMIVYGLIIYTLYF